MVRNGSMVIGWLKRGLAAGDQTTSTFRDDGGLTVRVRDTDLCLWDSLGQEPASEAHRIYLFKGRRFLSALAQVLDRIAPRTIVEIGILNGGSTIYWAERYRVDRLIAIELAKEAPYLTQYIERHGLSDRISVHFGLAQDDKQTIQRIVRRDLSEGQIDAVVDDASHQYRETRATFEGLFPWVRPGGLYIIEDWAWGHHKNWPAGLWKDARLMSPLLTELMLICGKGDGVIDGIEIDSNFAAIRRGAAPLPVDGSFELSRNYVSRGFSVTL